MNERSRREVRCVYAVGAEKGAETSGARTEADQTAETYFFATARLDQS